MAVINGDGGNNNLVGTSGDDEIYGLGGDDVIEGGGGIDVLDGGSGIDTLSYANSELDVWVRLDNGYTSWGALPKAEGLKQS